MELALLAARVSLALVIVVAGLAKLSRRESTREMLRAFLVPQSIVEPAAIALPAAELLTALLLVPAFTAAAGALLAAVLLTVFTIAIAVNLVRGRRPACQCFGALRARPVGTMTLARNGALLLVALVVVLNARVQEPASAFAWLSSLSLPEKVSALIAVASFGVSGATLFVVIQLVAQNGRLLVALDALRPSRDGGDASEDRGAAVPAAGIASTAGLAPGSRAPEFMLRDIAGRLVSLAQFRGMPTLLVFSDPQCGPCNALMPTVSAWQSELRDRLRVVLVSSGSLEANRAKAEVHRLSHMLLQEQQEVQTLFAAYGTPTAVLIGPDGAVASLVAQGRDDILALVKPFTEPMRPPVQRPSPRLVDRLPLGTPAPVRPLLDLFGQQATLAYSRSKATLLLFWNPDCGYCQKLLPELQAWATKDASAFDVVVVSTGSPEANLALGLPATVLLDHEFALGRDFNVQGTPSAIVVAPDGTVNSALAVGGTAVMGLARSPASAAVATML